MKKFYLLCFLFIGTVYTSEAQSFDLKDLMEFSVDKSDKFVNHIQRKGFERDNNNPDSRNLFFYEKEEKGKMVRRALNFSSAINAEHILYRTSCVAERSELDKQMVKAGFITYSRPASPEAFYQKGPYLLTRVTEEIDGVLMHTYSIVKQVLPNAGEINYAEDLQQLSSHENLVFIFGENNVVKEIFNYSETEKANCSILFPGTAREAIFIWTDQVHFRDIELLILGGSLETMTTKYLRLPHNQWRSKQGIYAGMTLKDLELRNGGPVSFYGWSSEMAGTLLPSNSGNINFKKLGLVLNCLNCDQSETRKLPVVNSSKETDDRRIYVTTLIIVPEKQTQVTALR